MCNSFRITQITHYEAQNLSIVKTLNYIELQWKISILKKNMLLKWLKIILDFNIKSTKIIISITDISVTIKFRVKISLRFTNCGTNNISLFIFHFEIQFTEYSLSLIFFNLNIIGFLHYTQ